MGLTSLQVCMDSSTDWLLQGAIHEEENNGMDDSSSSPSGADMLATCTMPPAAAAMMDQRRLRPPHDQALKCPRCDSNHTKFCYYNNYSLTQPRYFCKTCRRYWTKGGTLRNIPVGGGCRKNKKVSSSSSSSSSKKPSNKNNDHHPLITTTTNNQNPERLSPSQYSADFRVSQLNYNNLLGGHGHGSSSLGGGGFSLLGGHETISPAMPIDFMECSRNNLGSMVSGIGDLSGGGGGGTHGLGTNFHGFCSPFGFSLEGMENYQRLMLPYEGGGGGGGGGVINDDDNNNYQNGMVDVKPNTKLLSLDNWQDQNQGCSDAGKDYSIGYHLNGLGSWSGMMNNGF